MKINKLITHNGSFHADDIFASAALSVLFEKRGENFEIIRTRDKEIIKTGDIVFDVGEIYDEEKNRFDHHQPNGAGTRVVISRNGEQEYVKYSSFGLIWKKFGEEICGGEKIAEMLEEKLVAPIDASDTGFDLVENKYDIAPYFIQYFFSAMEPTWHEDAGKKDERFFECVKIAKTILSREIVQAEDIVLAEESLISVYENTEDKRIIVLSDNYPFEYLLHQYPEPLFAIYPRKTDGSWGAKAVREDPKNFSNRKDFPKAWGGLRDQELQEITGVPDAIFCHRGLFLAAAKSKEGAIELARKAVEAN